MKKLTISILALMTIGQATAQTTITGTEWDDPLKTSVNRETAHTLAIPMSSDVQVAQNDMTQSPYYQSLDGVWKFQWVGIPSNAKEEWLAKDFDDAAWTSIDVPSSWQVWGLNHGKSWDKPLYCNTSYPFSYNESTYSVMADRPSWFTYTGSKKNPVGTYRRHFTVPADWAGRNVYVRFNSVGHGYYLWVNGQRVGYSEDSYLPSEFNITDYLVEGDNTIALQVYRFTSGSFLECQDYWRLTGIHRSCFLWSAPKSQIRDYFFTTDLDASYTNAKANVKVTLEGADALSGGTVEARIERNGSAIATASASVAAELSLDMDVTAPDKWTAETPNLYDLVLTLKDSNGNVIDRRGGKVGFREVSIGTNGALLINGQRMVFHGVNRHDFSPINGRAITLEEIEQDILCMKRLNINAIRTSHYPNDPVFYDLCDKYGMYVLAEANVECHGNWNLSHVSQFKNAMVERSQNHVRWMRNHVCIFMWSFGNESGNGNNFAAVQTAIKALDKTRLTHYEGGSDYADVSSSMYWDYNGIKNKGMNQKNRPHIQCENSHSMGNSMGNVREMFDLYEQYPCLTGEFIWDFKDQGLLTTSSDGQQYWAYGGDFGDNPNDGNFCINGLVHPDWSYTAKTYNTKKIYQPLEWAAVSGKTDVFRMKNKLAFLSSTTYDVSYSLLDEEGNVLGSGTISDDVAAGQSKNITIDLSSLSALSADKEAFIYFCAKQKEATAWADAGYVVAEEKLPVKAAQKPMKDLTFATADALTVEETSSAVKVSGANFTASFSKSKGTLSGYTLDGVSVIRKALVLNAFRLPTDNDGSKKASWDALGLPTLSSTAKGTSTKVTKDDNGKTVTVSMKSTYGTGSNTFDVSLDFIVCADGTIMTNSMIRPKNTGAIIPKLGFRLELLKEMEQLSWFGRGPWDSYRDRKEACLPAIYNSTVTDQYEEYILPQEHGTKQEVRWMSVTNTDGLGLLFVAPDQMAASAVHFRPEDNYTDKDNRAKHTYQFKSCATTVVNLDAVTRGLGNNSCGPDVMDKYELRAANTAFRFFIVPLKAGVQAAQAARIDMPVCQPVSVDRLTTGRIQMSTPTEGATIWYSINGGEYQKYTATIQHDDACTITAYCSLDGLMDSPSQTYDFPVYINKSAWKVVSYDSQHSGNEASKAIDGKYDTFWHTEWEGSEPRCPHTLVIDIVQTYNITAITYLARQDGNANGMVKSYEFYLSNDKNLWGSPVASGEFKNTTALQTAKLNTPQTARYLKLIAKSEINGNAWSSCAELGIEIVPGSTGISCLTPNASSVGNGNVYDLQGRRHDVAESLPHGMYIMEGRKIVK
ncbi:MAG: discoidin domain-containing protein [Prevotella sp.]|nr:discoidin domain-containing protein [Prevotella sp.]